VSPLGAAAVLLAVPMLVAATPDRRGDVVSCATGAPLTDALADVVAVDGLATELGSAAVWRVTFAAPVPVPDRDGVPLRIDVLVRDPRLPPATLPDERGMNRIVRWDDVATDHPVDIVWLHGKGHTPFNPPAIDGRTVEITVPGRILLGGAENGTESVRRARWSVVVRDGDACDRVGGVPRFRLREAPAGSVPPHPTVGGIPTAADSSGSGTARFLPGVALFLVCLLLLATLARRARGR
jgi:hypothetical protein